MRLKGIDKWTRASSGCKVKNRVFNVLYTHSVVYWPQHAIWSTTQEDNGIRCKVCACRGPLHPPTNIPSGCARQINTQTKCGDIWEMVGTHVQIGCLWALKLHQFKYYGVRVTCFEGFREEKNEVKKIHNLGCIVSHSVAKVCLIVTKTWSKFSHEWLNFVVKISSWNAAYRLHVQVIQSMGTDSRTEYQWGHDTQLQEFRVLSFGPKYKLQLFYSLWGQWLERMKSWGFSELNSKHRNSTCTFLNSLVNGEIVSLKLSLDIGWIQATRYLTH